MPITVPVSLAYLHFVTNTGIGASLLRCLPSVCSQDYPPQSHCISGILELLEMLLPNKRDRCECRILYLS